MATYAIGDVQGCFDELTALLDKMGFDPVQDQLWFVGDLVNRGAQSLEVLRFVKQLGDNAVTVLGNHDLHLLAVACGQSALRKDDTLRPLLSAPDSDELLDWLRRRPLFYHDASLGNLVHAGLAPQWTVEQAGALAGEVEQALRSDAYADFFAHMYGDQPALWRDSLVGWERCRFITNCLTRLRYVDRDGGLSLKTKGPIGSQPAGCVPWFRHPRRRSRGERVIFGHWSTLGLLRENGVLCLDTGCVWGRQLTAVRLDGAQGESEVVQLPCKGARKPKA